MNIKQCKKCCPPPPQRGLIAPRIGMASRIVRSEFNQAVADEGLFAGQHQIIMILKHKKQATVSEIAEEIGVATSTVSVSIKRMEKAGFVAKKPSETDGRISVVYLTEKGEAAPEHIKTKLDAQETELTKNLSDEETLILSDLLDKIIENLFEKEEKHFD